MNTNAKKRPDKKRHTTELPGNQNALFSVPLSRWETYELAKQRFRDGSPPEVFFEPRADGKDIQNLEPGANQAGRRYDTDGISPTVPTAGGQAYPYDSSTKSSP